MRRIALLLTLALLILAPAALADGAPYEIAVYDEVNGQIVQVGTVMSDAQYTVQERITPLPGTPWATLFDTSGQIEWDRIAYVSDGEQKTGYIVGNPGVLMSRDELNDVETAEGFVLCQTLSMRESPSASAKVVKSLAYGSALTITGWEGEWMQVSAQVDGAAASGWVRSEYVLVDPAYYTSTGETAVYAYPGEDSPRVGLLSAGETYPIVAQLEGYTAISLRGASGFIRN